MKRKTVRFIIATILMASLLPVVPQTVLAEDITISTPAELEAFRDSVNGGTDYSGVTVTLTADIDLDGRWDKQWTPIGTNYNTPFAGTFDGGGHKITGLYINRPNEGHQGLFGVNKGKIQKLGVEGIVTGKEEVGGIAGENDEGSIINCFNFASVRGSEAEISGVVGGITGYSSGSVVGCYNAGDVVGRTMVGGIVGWNSRAYNEVINCYNVGHVEGELKFGGNIGGIVGWNGGRVINCYNSSDVINASGVVGENFKRSGAVTINCYYFSEMENDTETAGSNAIDKAAFAAHTTFQDWDFTNTWIMSAALGRPVLRAIPEDGSGTEKDCFVDVLQDMWYYEAVQDIFARGLMTGVSGTKFAPEETVTRGMFVTVLYRMENEPEPVQKYAFTDVSPDAYYAGATAWASEHGIVLGSEAKKFSPEETVTREQMAAILYRYAHYKGCDTGVNGIVSCMDSDKISTYALEAVVWLFDKQIMQGNENGAFLPEAYATRAETAAVFQKMIQYLA